MRTPQPHRGVRALSTARFHHIDGAERAFADARAWDPAADWIDHTALVEVHRDGRIVVRGSVAGHYVDTAELRSALAGTPRST